MLRRRLLSNMTNTLKKHLFRKQINPFCFKKREIRTIQKFLFTQEEGNSKILQYLDRVSPSITH